MIKSLKDISWQVTEPEYRADDALSYSTLAKYERGGRFDSLPSLFDRISTPSLTFGSIVDTLITGSDEEFDNTFFVSSIAELPQSYINITKALYDNNKGEYLGLAAIPNSIIIAETEIQGFYKNWKPETRAKVIKEKCSDYYNMLMLAEGKQVVTQSDVLDAKDCAEALKTNSNTKYFFEADDPFNSDGIERLYQLKFKGTNDGVNYRCMADLIVVDHNNKTIQPCDLKTSSHNEWEFYKSFTDFRYDIQARLYWRLIKQNIDKDEYFKDFKLLDYKFIVVNRKNKQPEVWDFPLTKMFGEIAISKKSGYTYFLRDPYTIGKELKNYLDNKDLKEPVEMNKSNNIVKFINNSI